MTEDQVTPAPDPGNSGPECWTENFSEEEQTVLRNLVGAPQPTEDDEDDTPLLDDGDQKEGDV